MLEEVHLWIDLIGAPDNVKLTLSDSFNFKGNILHTTIPHFLNWRWGKRLFAHVNGEMHEITLGECDGTNRLIKEGHNIEKMIYDGEFDWY